MAKQYFLCLSKRVYNTREYYNIICDVYPLIWLDNNKSIDDIILHWFTIIDDDKYVL